MKDMVKELNKVSMERKLAEENVYVSILRIEELSKEISGAKYRARFSINSSDETFLLRDDDYGDRYCIVSTESRYIIMKKITEIRFYGETRGSYRYNNACTALRIVIDFDDIEIKDQKEEHFIF